MPPRRGVRRKKGGRVAGAAASSVLARGACGDLEDKHQEHVQYIEDLVQGLKDKGERDKRKLEMEEGGGRPLRTAAVDQSRLLAPRKYLW